MSNIVGAIEVGDIGILDEETHTVVIQLDRIGVSFHVDEILEFYYQIFKIKEDIINHPGYAVGKLISEEGNKEIIMPIPSENDYV
jgi:hypothetical protein